MNDLLRSKFFLGVLIIAVLVVGGVAFLGADKASADCSITTTLRVGSTGAQVVCLQTSLGGLTTDGKFGPKTKAALVAWQKWNGLKTDGIFGPKSRTIFIAGVANTNSARVVVGNFQTGCTSTVGFSPTTGQSCVIPAGCSSALGFSPITGVSCSSDSVARIRSGIISAHKNIISATAIAGVTAPVIGATPVTSVTAGTGYTGTVSWSGSPVTFAGATIYTATITLTPTAGYTLTGVPANFFTISGAVATNAIDSGVVSAVFPATLLIQLTIASPTLTTTKEYDGDDTALVTAGALSGVTLGDTVIVSALATYDTSNVGTGKKITIIYTLGGADAGKYIKPINGTNTNGEITAKPITVTADNGQTKVYGASDPVFTYTPSPALIGGDVFTGTLSRVTGESVGTYAITQNDLSAGTNYSITFVPDDFLITVALRDPGPGGGLVFYVSDGGLHGLEAATTDQSTGIAWIIGGSTQTTSNGNTSLIVGTGQANTNFMIAQSGYTGGAAKVADDLVSGGKSDWFLPSKDELNLMYTNLKLSGVGGFASYGYWSSSEANANTAWAEYFPDGTQYATAKANALYVRAVRAF